MLRDSRCSIKMSCFRWREVKLLPPVNRKSSLSSPPAKLTKLDTCQNSVFFTSGDEAEASSSSVDNAVVNQHESAKACTQDIDSEVLL